MPEKVSSQSELAASAKILKSGVAFPRAHQHRSAVRPSPCTVYRPRLGTVPSCAFGRQASLRFLEYSLPVLLQFAVEF